MTSSDIVEALRTSELFTSLSEETIEMLAASLATAYQIKTYKAGDTIFMQGEHSTMFHIIADGQVLLQRSVNLGDRMATKPLGLLGKGRVMMWSALL